MSSLNTVDVLTLVTLRRRSSGAPHWPRVSVLGGWQTALCVQRSSSGGSDVQTTGFSDGGFSSRYRDQTQLFMSRLHWLRCCCVLFLLCLITEGQASPDVMKALTKALIELKTVFLQELKKDVLHRVSVFPEEPVDVEKLLVDVSTAFQRRLHEILCKHTTAWLLIMNQTVMKSFWLCIRWNFSIFFL